MNKEIERKFLVHVDKLPNLPQGRKIVQGYVHESNPLVRIRIIEYHAYIKAYPFYFPY